MKRATLNTNDLVKEYRAGLTATEIARKRGISIAAVYQHLHIGGIPRISGLKHPHLDIPAIVERYSGGESVNSLADSLGVSRPVIIRRLAQADIPLRSQSEAEAAKWNRMTQVERARQVAAAHAASLGTPYPISARLAHAQTVQERQLHVSDTERELADLLNERGIATVPQQAIGPYNCDLGASPVAVEVFGGNWHWGGRHLLRSPKRFRYILDAGWHIIVIWVSPKVHPLTAAAADYVASFIEEARRNPTAIREYRVIRRGREVVAAGRADDNEITIIPALRSGRDSLGRYTTIAR